MLQSQLWGLLQSKAPKNYEKWFKIILDANILPAKGFKSTSPAFSIFSWHFLRFMPFSGRSFRFFLSIQWFSGGEWMSERTTRVLTTERLYVQIFIIFPSNGSLELKSQHWTNFFFQVFFFFWRSIKNLIIFLSISLIRPRVCSVDLRERKIESVAANNIEDKLRLVWAMRESRKAHF